MGKQYLRTSWPGPIGQLLSGAFYQDEPVVFVPVVTPLLRPPEEVVCDLSADPCILLEFMLGISLRTVDACFVKSRPGPLSHARWLITAKRILILYTRMPEPSTVHKLLVQFIQTI